MYSRDSVEVKKELDKGALCEVASTHTAKLSSSKETANSIR